MPASLWPDFPPEAKPRGMRQMLEEAGGDIEEKTQGAIQFRVKVYPDGERLHHDCYLIVARVRYPHLLLRVTTGLAPFPATLVTPSGREVRDIRNEATLRDTLQQHFHTPDTRDLVNNLLGVFEGVEPLG